jgi:hypothetical protein
MKRLRAEAGFSILEVMVAAALLLIISLGIIPLFARSIRENATGSDYTQGTNGGRSRLEEAKQLPFNSLTLEVPDALTEGVVSEEWAQGATDQVGDDDEGWDTGVGTILWERRTLTHQYSMGALDKQLSDYTLEEDERRVGGTQATFVQLKEVVVEMQQSERSLDLFGGRRTVVLRVLKPY